MTIRNILKAEIIDKKIIISSTPTDSNGTILTGKKNTDAFIRSDKYFYRRYSNNSEAITKAPEDVLDKPLYMAMDCDDFFSIDYKGVVK